MKTHTPADGRTAHLTFALPATVIDEIADAVAERLRDGDLGPARSPWLDVEGAADYLGMTADAVRKAAQRGLLPAHQPFGKGSRYFFHYRELDEHLLAAATAGEVAGVDAAGVNTANGVACSRLLHPALDAARRSRLESWKAHCSATAAGEPHPGQRPQWMHVSGRRWR